MVRHDLNLKLQAGGRDYQVFAYPGVAGQLKIKTVRQRRMFSPRLHSLKLAGSFYPTSDDEDDVIMKLLVDGVVGFKSKH